MLNSKSHWSHREPRATSKLLLRAMIVLLGLFLLLQLTGCVNTRTVYVPVPPVPLSVNLTTETPQPKIPDPLTYRASLDLNVSLFSSLAQCNRDKADIREIERNRVGQADGTIKR